MAGKSIDDVFADILKDCKSVATEVVKKAAKKTQKDILKEAKNYLAEYYKYKPKRYKRTYQLQNAIIPVFKKQSNKDMISFEVGVRYDSTPLIGKYRSNSWYHQTGTKWISSDSMDFDFDSQNNGIPEAGWILDNFLLGIHKWGDGPDEYEQDRVSTNTLMEKFFENELPARINQYVQEELFAAITSKL